MKSLETLLADNDQLIHSRMQTITNHVQKQKGDWILNTVFIAGHDVPFQYRRRKRYRSLKGARVDMLYYRAVDQVAGIDFEYMKVVKIQPS